MWGKFLNNGQTCVAPDYIYVHNRRQRCIYRCVSLRDSSALCVTPNEQKTSLDLTRIVNQRHTQRVAGLLNDAVEKGKSNDGRRSRYREMLCCPNHS